MERMVALAFFLGFVMCVNVYANGLQRRIPVTDAKEIYKTVTVQVPVQKCHPVELQQQVEVPCPSQPNTDRNSLGIDTLLGAAAGAVIGGATIDRHKSSDTGKIVGGIVGAIGANQARGRIWGKGSKCYETRTIQDQRCTTEYEYKEKTIQDGWRLCGNLNGETVCIKSPVRRDYLQVVVQ